MAAIDDLIEIAEAGFPAGCGEDLGQVLAGLPGLFTALGKSLTVMADEVEAHGGYQEAGYLLDQMAMHMNAAQSLADEDPVLALIAFLCS